MKEEKTEANMERDGEPNQEMGRGSLWKKLKQRQEMRGGMERGEDEVKQKIGQRACTHLPGIPARFSPLLILGRVIPSQTGASSCACIALTQIIPVHTGPPVKRLYWFTLPTESGDYSKLAPFSSMFVLRFSCMRKEHVKYCF